MLTVGALQVCDVEDVDGAAVWGRGCTAAEDRCLAFGVAVEGWDGDSEGGAGEGDGGDDGCGEMHGWWILRIVWKIEMGD